MPNKPKTLFKKRAFLNDDMYMSGFILVALQEFTYPDEGGCVNGISCYPALDIGDCSNKVSLDLSFYTVEGMRKSLKKIRLLRDTINGFADAFEQEVTKFEEKRKKEKNARSS